VRVLVAHNMYRSAQPSGENTAVRDEIDLLRRAGLEVAELIENSDEISHHQPSPRGMSRFEEIVEESRPDILHAHNVYPLISPWILRRSKQLGIPVVHTVHNYRHVCLKGTHERDGSICTRCSPSGKIAALQYGCYRGSRVQTAAMLAGSIVTDRIWKEVDRFLVLSDFMRQRLIEWGVAPSKISEHAGWSWNPGDRKPASKAVLFVGRLEANKGIGMLLDAWIESGIASAGWELRVAGAGALKGRVEKEAASGRGIEWLGSLGPQALAEAYAAAGVVAVPSLSFEGYPRVLAEGAGHGRCGMVSAIGSLRSIASGRPDLIAIGPSTQEWARALKDLEFCEVERRGIAARAHWASALSDDAALGRLLAVYGEVTSR
jgi:glycosyltransferase involved in cell wall biosynthesis